MDSSFNIVNFLKSAVNTGASDEHLVVGHPPYIRKNGFMMKTNMEPITKEVLESAIIEIAPTNIKDSILKINDLDFMYEIKDFARFRINYNRQIGFPGLVIRNIAYKVPALKDLNLPELLNKITNFTNGIVLVTGPTGSGKSTTLAALIDTINASCHKHIVTIEDPIEYVYGNKKSVISQRQIGVDTPTFANGIKYSLRQDPDVIFIGEIRDKETMEAALKASETGHLVLTTLHTNDAVQTINRMVNMFDEQNRTIVRNQIAETLRATIAQKLVFSEAKQKRFPACEIMVITPTIKDYIHKENYEEIYNLLKEGGVDNMVSLNTSLANLVNTEFISKEEALAASNDKQELEQYFRGIYQGTKAYYE